MFKSSKFLYIEQTVVLESINCASNVSLYYVLSPKTETYMNKNCKLMCAWSSIIYYIISILLSLSSSYRKIRNIKNKYEKSFFYHLPMSSV